MIFRSKTNFRIQNYIIEKGDIINVRMSEDIWKSAPVIDRDRSSVEQRFLDRFCQDLRNNYDVLFEPSRGFFYVTDKEENISMWVDWLDYPGLGSIISYYPELDKFEIEWYYSGKGKWLPADFLNDIEAPSFRYMKWYIDKNFEIYENMFLNYN